jgi:hypothetical protein
VGVFDAEEEAVRENVEREYVFVLSKEDELVREIVLV